MLALLHLCDSLFPIGAFSHSDGLEGATARGLVSTADDLRDWMDACLHESLGPCEGLVVRLAWESFSERRWADIDRIDEEMEALRPSSMARAASRSMGTRLVRTWQQIRPDHALAQCVAGRHDATVTLPVAFGMVSAAADIDRRSAVEGFIYTRLAAAVSSAMRLLPLGQYEAHAILAGTLARAPEVVDAILESHDRPSAFVPALDLAVMSQQYVQSRLFRS